jgi:large subunit ribosomal protein L9
MYGSIGTREIADNFSKIDITVDIKSIRLPEGTLKELGSYSIDIELHPEIIQSVNINITPEV